MDTEIKNITEVRKPVTGCGCFSLIILIISIAFFCSFLVNSCNRGSVWEGAVETVHDYYVTADSIWKH